jgi:hypothetical protein
MKKISTYLLIVCMLPLLNGCKQAVLSPQQYMDWVRNEDNGLHLSKTIDDFSFSLQYKPFEYVMFLQLGKEKAIRSLVESKRGEMDGMQYYTLQIKGENRGEIVGNQYSTEEQAVRLEYFMGPAQDDIVLVEGTDTLPCVLYHFERSYNLDNGNALVLGFGKSAKSGSTDKQLIYQDQVLNTGPVQFTISHAAIQQIPQIRYEQE